MEIQEGIVYRMASNHQNKQKYSTSSEIFTSSKNSSKKNSSKQTTKTSKFCQCLTVFAIVLLTFISLLTLNMKILSNNGMSAKLVSIKNFILQEKEIIPVLDHSHLRPKRKPRKRLAYVITITKDGYFGLDGAAVLAYSIIQSSNQNSTSQYDISFIALVHPNVTTTRAGLQKLGFHGF
jgi:hypothetical protein